MYILTVRWHLILAHARIWIEDDKKAQRRAAAEKAACKQIKLFLSSNYDNFTASELLDLI